MTRLCFFLSSLLPGIVAGQGGCPIDANGRRQCSGTPVEDDGTLLMQHKSLRSPEALLQVSDLLQQNGGTGHRSVASLAESMRDMAVKSADGQTLPDDMMSILDSISGHMKSIRDGIQSEHSNDVKSVQNANASIHECAEVVDTAFQKSGGLVAKAAVSAQKGQALSTCRTEEKTALDTKTEKCKNFNDFLANLRRDYPKCASSQSCGLPADSDALLQCQKEIETWTDTYSAASHEAKKADCTTKTSEHTSKTATCDAEQVTFEQGYTAYAQLLTTTCEEQTACFVKEEKAKNSTCTLVQSNVELRKSEYIASQKVTCYIDVLKIDESKADAKKAKLQECDKSVDATSLKIACPESPSPSTCDTSVIVKKPCDDCAEIVLETSTQSATPAEKRTCADWLQAGAADTKEYDLTYGDGKTYKAKCDMEHHGGGWTLFATIQSRSGLTCTGGEKEFCTTPESTEFVDTCKGQEWIFSRSSMIDHGGQLMARQIKAPHKTFLVDWLYEGSQCTGEKFFKIVTGDYARDASCKPRMFDFGSKQWVQSGDGWCNSNDHSQFNCVAQSYSSNGWPANAPGVRFHWGTRNTRNDGGSCNQINSYWTGWTAGYGSSSALVENFDSWDGQSGGPVELFYRR